MTLGRGPLADGDAEGRDADGRDLHQPEGHADGDTASTVVLDADGVIVSVNQEWLDFCRTHDGDPDACGPGVSYLEVCDGAGGDPVASRAGDLVRRALRGEVSGTVRILVPCPASGTSGWFDMLVRSRLEDGGRCEGAVVSFCERIDLTRPPGEMAELEGVEESGSELLTFPDVPRLELEDTLVQLTQRAADVLKAQGRLRALLRANALVTADLKIEVVLERLVRASRDLVASRHAALHVLAKDGSLEQLVHTDMTPDQLRRLEQPRSDRAVLAVPVTVRGTLFGVLYLAESLRGAFTEEDQQLATSLARTAAVAIENARLFADSEGRRRWQIVTTKATQLLFAGEEPMGVVLESAVRGADGDLAVFAVLDGEDVVARHVAGDHAERLHGRHIPLDESVLEDVLRKGNPILEESYRNRRSSTPPLDPPVVSLIGVPLIRGDRVLGAVLVGRLAGRGSFDRADLDQLEGYVGHVGVALELNQSRSDQESLLVLREHQRIAADLHDHVIQELFATGMGLQSMVYRIDDPVQSARIGEYVDAIDATIRRIRTTIFQLSRPSHGGGSLKERLLAVVEDARPALGFAAHVEFSGLLDQAVPAGLADDALAVAREGLSNAARHANASSVRLRVTLTDDVLTVDVIDNGSGVDNPSRSSGLANLRLRARRYAGDLAVIRPPGGGTHLHWTALTSVAD
jgi:signal transduction histidine kinase